MAAAEAIAEAMAADERRAARDAWRRRGGSQRRALRTFSTREERAAKRAELRAERAEARAFVATAEGAATLAEARELNPHLSETNAAIVANRLPGRIVGTAAYWRRNGARVNKGEQAALFIGGGPHVSFAPVAAFTAAQTTAGAELADVERPPAVSDPLPAW